MTAAGLANQYFPSCGVDFPQGRNSLTHGVVTIFHGRHFGRHFLSHFLRKYYKRKKGTVSRPN